MTRTKKFFATFAVAAATAGAAASPALADSHMPSPPRGDAAVVTQDSHTPMTPQGDSHMPAPPLG
ncbi:hypothetical protein [Streptomyces sp. NPDC087300]|uniref:hypothetical protein n=1 Tax=Streptomyces sp. NPDC087300 TaxID=3365780 RepID=UPI00380B689C